MNIIGVFTLNCLWYFNLYAYYEYVLHYNLKIIIIWRKKNEILQTKRINNRYLALSLIIGQFAWLTITIKWDVKNI